MTPIPSDDPVPRQGLLRRMIARVLGLDAVPELVTKVRQLRSQQRESAHWQEKIEHQLSVLVDTQKKLLKEVRTGRRDEARWRWRFRQQLDALMRQQAVAGTDIMAPLWLEGQRFRLRSQNEEDGILIALLRAAGVTNRRFVEIGSGKTGGNSAVLAFEFGWSGLMVDAGAGKIEVLARVLASNPGVTAVQAFVTPDTFNELLRTYGCTGDIDVMSIDVDTVDYWLLDALHVCSPRILVMEYNAGFGPSRAVTLPPTLPEGRLMDGYFGASLAALEKKAREKGYGLVLCEPAGINAFFLRNDVAPEIPRLTPAQAYRRPVRVNDDGEPVDLEGDLLAMIEAHKLPLVDV